MKKGIKKIKINQINFVKKYYIPSRQKLRKWIICSIEKIFNIEITLIMAGTQRIKSINQRYLNKDQPTNVLSFNNSTDTDKRNLNADIIICPEVIFKEAMKYSISIDTRWAHMIIHSMLHLQGYNHDTYVQRNKMEKKEIYLLRKMKFGNPYVTN